MNQENSLIISEVQILPIKPKDGLIAFASCVINGQLYLGNIGVHTRADGNGYRLVFPAKILPSGKQIQCFHPICKDAGELLLDAIKQKLDEISFLVSKNKSVSSI